MLFDSPETTEAAKLLDTEYYRACIEFCEKAKSVATLHGLSFHEVYTLWNQTYNEGYTALSHPEYVRPVLQPISHGAGFIGGHCVGPNRTLLKYD